MTDETSARSEPITVGSETINPGERRNLDLTVARLPTMTVVDLPVVVINGARPGAHLWLSAAIHGDELNGVDIIRRVVATLDPKVMSGAVIAVPIVNVFGFIQQSRYLPDGRDLNRMFPGSAKGSLASSLAHLFMTEIVSHCTHGVDLHTGTSRRSNLPQIRADLDRPETRRMAAAFAAPAMIHGKPAPGSLRAVAPKRYGTPVVVFEGGQDLRFDEPAITMGVAGVRRVLLELGIMAPADDEPARPATVEIRERVWVRARRGGILRLRVDLGDIVAPRQEIGIIADAFGEQAVSVRAPGHGLVIGRNNNPVVHRGDPVVHLGRIQPP